MNATGLIVVEPAFESLPEITGQRGHANQVLPPVRAGCVPEVHADHAAGSRSLFESATRIMHTS